MFIFLAGLLLTKYYTETIVRGLRAKAREQQKTLADVKHALTTRQEKMMEVEKEEKAVRSRLDRLQALIADIQIEINEAIVRTRRGAEGETGTAEN